VLLDPRQVVVAEPVQGVQLQQVVRACLGFFVGTIAECMAVCPYSFIYDFEQYTYGSEAFIDRPSEAILRAWNRSGLRR